MNFQELNFAIDTCKQNLKRTDYQAIKHSEGLISEEEYKPTKEQREEWRRQINEYEKQLPEAEAAWKEGGENVED